MNTTSIPLLNYYPVLENFENNCWALLIFELKNARYIKATYATNTTPYTNIGYRISILVHTVFQPICVKFCLKIVHAYIVNPAKYVENVDRHLKKLLRFD